MNAREEIKKKLTQAVYELTGQDVEPQLTRPKIDAHGDYTSNVAMVLFKSGKGKAEPLDSTKGKSGKFGNPLELAKAIASRFTLDALPAGRQGLPFIDRVEVAPPGFINFTLSKEHLIDILRNSLTNKQPDVSDAFVHKKIMVEYAHPNTHKEMHIGHMRTMIVGEALARLYEACGAVVFRANYQGDIGPHVAKALYGIQKVMEEKGLTLEDIDKWSHADKAHFLGDGYVRGSQEYKEKKAEIDAINKVIYQGVVRHSGERSDSRINIPSSKKPDSGQARMTKIGQGDFFELYKITHKWSLDYYEDFYKRFYTKFDKLFLESAMAEKGKKIVEENVGKVFVRDQGAIVFKGEQYARPPATSSNHPRANHQSVAGEVGRGLHTRVFVTSVGNPTYEGKEMANGFAEWKAFPFDLKVHVVGSEQAGYFQVVFKALELLDPKKFKDKQHHVSMGMVQLSDRKMSSRTGDILRVDWLIDEVAKRVDKLISISGSSDEEKSALREQITIGAIKYSVLKVGTGQNVAFDIEKSLALDGDSGPYLQYTYARTQSVLGKADSTWEVGGSNPRATSHELQPEEVSLLRSLTKYPEIVEQAATEYAPNVLAGYLFDLAQKFNLFYQKHKIINPVILASVARPESVQLDPGQARMTETEDNTIYDFRLSLTAAVGKTLKDGLHLLGIKAPERM